VLLVQNKGPYGLLGLCGHLRLTHTDCCVVQGHPGLAVLHPYCFRMWINYDGVQVTAQQRCGGRLGTPILVYEVLFSVGRGSMLDMYLNYRNLGTYSPVLSSTQIDSFYISLTLSVSLSARLKSLVISGRLLFHFSPPLQPNKPFMLALVCVNTFGPVDHPQ
jgi:hypothetical protein